MTRRSRIHTLCCASLLPDGELLKGRLRDQFSGLSCHMWVVGSVSPSVRSDQALRSMNGCDNGARTHHHSSLPPCCLSHCVRRAAPFLLLLAAVLLLALSVDGGCANGMVRSPAEKEESDRSTHR